MKLSRSDFRNVVASMFDSLHDEYDGLGDERDMSDGIAVLVLRDATDPSSAIDFSVMLPRETRSTEFVRGKTMELMAKYPEAESCLIGFFANIMSIKVDEDGALKEPKPVKGAFIVTQETNDHQLAGMIAKFTQIDNHEDGSEQFEVSTISEPTELHDSSSRFGYVLPINQGAGHA